MWGLSFRFIFSLSFLLLLGRHDCPPKGWSDFHTLIEGELYSLGHRIHFKIWAAAITYTLVSCCQLKPGQHFHNS